MCNDAFVAGFFWGWLVTGATVLAALIYRRTRGVTGTPNDQQEQPR